MLLTKQEATGQRRGVSARIARFACERARPGFAVLAAALLASCGGGSANPFGNPDTVSNPPVVSGQHLAFAYFQRCIEPIFQAQLAIAGSSITNTCAGSGCHANATGSGGAFRLQPNAATIDVTLASNTPAVIRASDIYKNFYSAQGEVVIGSTTQSRLLTKPLLLGVLHGGGQIFSSQTDANAKLIAYWLTHPSPQAQDEFSTATYSMFTPADPKTGTCNTQ